MNDEIVENDERVLVSTHYTSVGLEHDFSDLCDNEIKLQVLAGNNTTHRKVVLIVIFHERDLQLFV